MEHTDVAQSFAILKKQYQVDGSIKSVVTPAATFSDIPLNPIIIEMMGILKKEILDMIDTMGIVKFWLQLNMPKYKKKLLFLFLL